MKQFAPAAVAVAVLAAIAGASLSQQGSAPASLPSTAITQPDRPDTPAGTAQPSGPGLFSPQFDQAQGPGAAMQMGVEIVVKFKDDRKVKDIVDAFWKDQASARAKFDAFRKGRPELAGLKLARVTYSNELVLVPEGAVAPAQRMAAARDIVAKLKGAADISYAEPNVTAQPGGH